VDTRVTTYLTQLDAVLGVFQLKPHNVGFVHHRRGLWQGCGAARRQSLLPDQRVIPAHFQLSILPLLVTTF